MTTQESIQKQSALLLAFLTNPLSDDYRTQRRTLLYVSLFLALMVITGGILRGPFGELEVKGGTLLIAKALAVVVTGFLVFSMWHVAVGCFRVWRERWRAEEALYLASVLSENQDLADEHRKESMQTAAKERRTETIDRLTSRINELERKQREAGDSKERLDAIDRELSEKRRELLEAKERTFDVSYEETPDRIKKATLLAMIERYGRMNSDNAVSASPDRVEAYRLFWPYVEFEKLRHRYTHSILRGRLDPVAATAVALVALGFFIAFVKPPEAKPAAIDKIVTEIQLWRLDLLRRVSDADSDAAKFVWFPPETDVFTMSFPLFERGQSEIAGGSAPETSVAASISAFLQSLVECNRPDAPVRVRFVGYADGKISDGFGPRENVRLANSRAASLYALRPVGLPYTVELFQWPENAHLEMRQGTRFSDTSSVTGGLGRRVDLEVVEAGACDQDALLEFYSADVGIH